MLNDLLKNSRFIGGKIPKEDCSSYSKGVDHGGDDDIRFFLHTFSTSDKIPKVHVLGSM